MNIEYYIEAKYGKDQRYPVSVDARMLCALMGTKTLTASALTILARHGHRVEQVFRPEEVIA